ncbi:unnamed protein product [Durusdinium trenchii]|uniref:Uncharacterized protein n=1 Tax=Durusdinium trenchii TaxID=1381693 RepID=A0ABP0RUK1_9DINO
MEPLLEEPQPWTWAIDRYFSISLRGSTIATELRAGTTAFLATANNFVVNAHIMSHAGLHPETSLVSGAFAAGVTCILCGMLSNLPLGLVPSVGPNVYIAYSLVGPRLFSTQQALAISATSGVCLVLLSLTPLLRIVLGLMPLSIKYGLLVGTGLLTAFIGLKSIGVVTAGEDIVALGDLNSTAFVISAASLVFTASLLYNAVTGAVLLGMLSSTLIAWIYLDDWPTKIFALQGLSFSMPNFDALSQQQAFSEIASLMLMLLFSLSGAIIGTAKMAGLLQEDGGVRGSTAVYMSSGLGTLLAAFLGTSPIFVSMSAAAGVRDGGRTGLVSLVIGVYSLLTAFVLSPLASAIPECAIAPVLVLVGVSMTGEAREIQWWNMLDALPAFLCAVFQPFTYSVSNGIYAGVAMSFILFFTTGSFLAYIPSFQKTEPRGLVEEVSAMIEHSPQQRYSSPKVVPEEEDSDVAPVRQGLIHLGLSGKQEALHLLESAAEMLGLDSKKMMEVVLECLDAGRNVESHYMGGIPGFETAMADQELHRRHLFRRSSEHHMDAASIAARALRNRRSM